MSGHSHAKTIKREKNITDQKRGQIFSKMARLIWVAVREGGPKPEANSKLKLAIDAAKSCNLPKENIERAIKRATGEVPGEKLEEVLFEAYGPGGIAIIIEGITDNKNRALGEVKQILTQNGGKLVDEGAVKWMFERKGCITLRIASLSEEVLSSLSSAEDSADGLQIKNKGEIELKVIEAGAEDLYWHEDVLDIYTKPEKLEEVKKNLEGKGIEIESASLDWVAKEEIEVEEKTKEAAQKLFEGLDGLDSVQEIYSNLKM